MAILAKKAFSIHPDVPSLYFCLFDTGQQIPYADFQQVENQQVENLVEFFTELPAVFSQWNIMTGTGPADREHTRICNIWLNILLPQHLTTSNAAFGLTKSNWRC